MLTAAYIGRAAFYVASRVHTHTMITSMRISATPTRGSDPKSGAGADVNDDADDNEKEEEEEEEKKEEETRGAERRQGKAR